MCLFSFATMRGSWWLWGCQQFGLVSQQTLHWSSKWGAAFVPQSTAGVMVRDKMLQALLPGCWITTARHSPKPLVSALSSPSFPSQPPLAPPSPPPTGTRSVCVTHFLGNWSPSAVWDLVWKDVSVLPWAPGIANFQKASSVKAGGQLRTPYKNFAMEIKILS